MRVPDSNWSLSRLLRHKLNDKKGAIRYFYSLSYGVVVSFRGDPANDIPFGYYWYSFPLDNESLMGGPFPNRMAALNHAEVMMDIPLERRM